MIKKEPEIFLSLEKIKISESDMDRFDIDSIVIEPLLFQTGYLSVKEIRHDGDGPDYIVEIPNQEVRNAFNAQIPASFTEKSDAFAGNSYRQIRDALSNGDLDMMLVMMRQLFSSIPYELHVNREAYYHSIFYAMMSLLGFRVEVEKSVARGRIDAVVERGDRVYVMEFKYVNCNPDAAEDEKDRLSQMALDESMKQINNRGYHMGYAGSGKTVYLVALVFLGRDDIRMQYV
jgi:hypothetical protein